MDPSSQGVTIRVANTFSSFQLLELPPELLSIIENGSAQILHLKSEAEPEDSAPSRASSLAVVCSGNKTFEVRQAQSSNSLYVLQSSPGPQEASSMTAIALCKAALELVPSQPDAVQFLARALPVAREPDDDAVAAAHAGETVSKAALQTHAPFSAAEFEAAWRELCAFERDGFAWQPSSGLRLGMWTSFTSAAAVSGVKLMEEFDPSSLKALIEEDGYTAELFLAILSRLSADDATTDRAQIDRSRCVSWLGTSILEGVGSAGTSESALRQRWRELLPDAWEVDARLDAIAGHYRVDGSTIYSTEARTADQKAPAKGPEQVRPKNKWHSKFAA